MKVDHPTWRESFVRVAEFKISVLLCFSYSIPGYEIKPKPGTLNSTMWWDLLQVKKSDSSITKNNIA